MSRGAISRADLLRALIAHSRQLSPEAVEALGFAPSSERPPAPVETGGGGKVEGDTQVERPQPATGAPLAEVPFWRAVEYEPDEIEIPSVMQDTAPPQMPTRPLRPPPPYSFLAPFGALIPRLRAALGERREERAYDLPRIVASVSRGETLRRLPRRHRAGWGSSLYVIEDRSDHLAPYALDQAMVSYRLSRLYPAVAFHSALYSELHERPLVHFSEDDIRPIAPRAGDQVLVLGDLGCLVRDGGGSAAFWHAFGAELRDLGVPAVALLPCAPATCSPELALAYRLLSWEHPAPRVLSEAEMEARGEILLAHLSSAGRIEPGLLRDIRLSLGADRLPACMEAWAWQHPAMAWPDMAATSLASEEAVKRRALFEQDEAARAQTVRSVEAWLAHRPYEIWLETVANLGAWADESVVGQTDRAAASKLLRYLAARVGPQGGEPLGARSWSWLEGATERLGERAKNDPETRAACWALLDAVERRRLGVPPPPETREIMRWRLHQHGRQFELLAETGGEYRAEGSPIALLRSRDGRVEIRPEASFWESGKAPHWAHDWGRDQYGAWVTFSVQDADGQPVIQRMRWIEPGSFLMGSPEDEPERYGDEGPQHRVTIGQGFWLFDTACPQELWQAVMGQNPSHFTGKDRPVERVSWDDARRFIAALNERLPGIDLALPSEAQWEYACRAGTTTPFHFGANITTDQVNFDGNYPYRGGAKGENRRQTVAVRSLPPNAWGLYEMHGNVREWVQDAWHGSYEGAPDDGGVWETGEPGASRVIRGGSWLGVARCCRSASRYGYVPGLRDLALGFRCARAQVSQAGGRRAEPASPARGGQAERPPPQGSPGAADQGATWSRWLPRFLRGASGNQSSALGTTPGPGSLPSSGEAEDSATPLAPDGEGTEEAPSPVLVRLENGASQHAGRIPGGSALLIRTDQERLVLRRRTRPAWASAMGRDRYGLWAEIAVEREAAEPVIQGLRWIPPGRFVMGSPKEEPGRWDAEGPQHEVIIGQGYWLFDTPCTQALWEAVMGENPSRFRDPERPVEGVSWDGIQEEFLPKLNSRIPGFGLPSEAQWEYACRAGTTTALYSGPIEIRGDMDAPTLDPIAWYGGNSGVDFDQSEGEDSTSGWWEGKQKQYDHKQAGTRKVKGKRPNPWGLYDMLGNVYEWVQDPWHESYKGAPNDGSVWESDETGAFRVFRGGSWDALAGGCRSACRDRLEPGDRDFDLGFRCARGQA